MKKFDALLCYSFGKENDELKEGIKKLLENFQFNVEILNYHGNNSNIVEIIKDKMKKVDAIFIIYTKDISQAVRDEASIAYHFWKKKLFVFFEDSHEVEGFLAKKDYAFAVFERKNLCRNLLNDGMLKSLLEFHESLTLKGYMPLYSEKLRERLEKIVNEQTVITYGRRIVEVIQDNLTFLEIPIIYRAHRKTDKVKVKKFELTSIKINEIEVSKNSNSYVIVSNNDFEFKVIVKINKMLKLGDTVELMYWLERNNNYKRFAEDINCEDDRITFFRDKKYNRISAIIRHPTDKLVQKVELPRDWKIKNYGKYVALSASSNRNPAEEKKCQLKNIQIS